MNNIIKGNIKRTDNFVALQPKEQMYRYTVIHHEAKVFLCQRIYNECISEKHGYFQMYVPQ